ncbi:hypothetical protein Y032_0779g2293 [Ancylostoma ceylanicum]|uniref:Helix-turn-helix domain-containing protein n=1 Tax=Ancylostoma ceylanicum TaxID=53326 RepID=A0A016WF26_9BILA|nr:hypothetical protein Y032_0779g2293 [Ancylostoma ceylanicum]
MVWSYVKWYRKESSKNIIVRALSAHPTAVKRAVVRNMIKMAIGVSSGETEKQESLELVSSMLHSNGYQAKAKRARTPRIISSTVSRTNKIPLCLSFISDRIRTAIRRCLVRAQLDDDVILVKFPMRTSNVSWSEPDFTIEPVSQKTVSFVLTEKLEIVQKRG